MAANDQRCCHPLFWTYLLVCVALVMFAGLMSGLTLGLMSLSLVDLEVLVKAGQPRDRRNAAKILPVVKNQHLLLCTLLIGNALAMEALPIFLDALLPAWGAILISVTLILAFGEVGHLEVAPFLWFAVQIWNSGILSCYIETQAEMGRRDTPYSLFAACFQIIPQAVCSHYGLSVGARMAPFVRVLLLLFFPIAYPISKLLDWLLGKGHFALLRRAELKTLVDMHGNEAGKGGELTHDETTIISGALDLTQKTAKDAMTPISETFSLDINSKLDMDTMGLIMTKGHSRVPIYSGGPTNIIGLILVKNLITCRHEDEVPVRNVTIRKIPRVPDDLPLYDILNEFQKGHSHMAVVVKHAKDPGTTMEKFKASMSESRINQNQKHTQIDGEGNRSHVVRNMDQHGDVRPQLRKWERGRHHNILDDLDSLPSYPSDEEVIGIITMEDVMEELLQEEILDETDEYVDVHNKIRINMLPPNKSSPRSPLAASISQFQRRTPVASPLSPYHYNSIVNSPASSAIQAPGPTPAFSSPPRKSVPGSPVEHAVASHSSPSNRVSRSSYEKLQKDGL